ncbi:peroxidase family protein [Streptomyces qaidamensis]|uniref:peroxidase family protein n=1 Tax=Streptomyces qaidamensis TaxID=1783515 RepID=UPI0036671EC9
MDSTESQDVALRTADLQQRLLDQLLGNGDGHPPLGLVEGPFAQTTYTDHGCPLRLATDGAGAAGVAQQPPVTDTSYYQWLFPDLAGFCPDDAAIKKLGAPCGPMDNNPPTGLNTMCSQLGPPVSLFNHASAIPPLTSPRNPAKEGIPAGYTYLGQFLDHNITFQADATFDTNTPGTTANYRSARIDLEHVYGLGPQTQAFQYYDINQTGKFWIDPDREFDVPRNPQGCPIIADPRNDNTIITIQLHLAFMKFHNAVVDLMRGSVDDLLLFSHAKKRVVWHYQWMILNDWLPRIIRETVHAQIMSQGPQFYEPVPGQPLLLPVEFSVACYRLHSLVLETYALNDSTSGHIFNFRKPFAALSRDEVIDWTRFFAIPRSTSDTQGKRFPQWAKRFDAKIVHAFLQMPGPIDNPLLWIDNPEMSEPLPKDPSQKYVPLRSIAIRNMLRANSFERTAQDAPNLSPNSRKGLPSGQDLASRVRIKYPKEPAEVYDNYQIGIPEDWYPADKAPLWFYALREGAIQEECPDIGSLKLGTLASVIVGEVLYGLVAADPGSYLAYNQGKNEKDQWKPNLGLQPGTFYMSDLFRVAGLA